MRVGDEELNLGVIHIPKRPLSEHSVSMEKDAHDNKSNVIFTKNSTFFRSLDECRQAKTQEDFVFLMSARDFDSDKPVRRSKILTHNLPDKNFICPDFVGRTKIIQALWAWLGDEFEYAKVLAGEGGKGKTSIAYEFCRLLISAGAPEFEQVVWLTAKESQFKANIDEYVDTPDVHFSDTESLLVAICKEVGGASDEELEDAGLNYLKRLAQEYLQVIPSFIVVDDVDSVGSDEQKRILEAARSIASGGSRVLLTTRANISYSSDSSISVPGLEGKEFEEFLSRLCERFDVNYPGKKKLLSLEIESGGSPLFVESIVRLVKRWNSFDKAINQWRGEKGESVRNAALRREINDSSPESRKILLTLSLVGSCSLTEITEYTDLERVQVEDAIEQLGSLFLLSSVPIIEDEPRFEVPRTISNMVVNSKDDMLPNSLAFMKSISERTKHIRLNKKGERRPDIAKAIAQANAMLTSRNYVNARETVVATLDKSEFKDNPDLLLMMGKICYVDPESSIDQARNYFGKAFSKGQRKELLFDLWFEAELVVGSLSGRLDVCDLAINKGALSSALWYRRAAEARLEMSKASTQYARSIELLVQGYGNVNRAILTCPSRFKKELHDIAKEIVDLLWDFSNKNGENLVAFKAMVNAVRSGDVRRVNYRRAFDSLKLIYVEKGSRVNSKDKGKDIVSQCKDSFESIISSLRDADRSDLYEEMIAKADTISIH